MTTFRRSTILSLLVITSVGCESLLGLPSEQGTVVDAEIVSVDAEVVSVVCDPTQPFGTPINIGRGVNTALLDFGARLSADQLTVYFATSDAVGDSSIATATRPTVQDTFGPAILIDALNSAAGAERDPSITADNLTIYFASTRIAGGVTNDLFVATRSTTAAEFGTPALVAGVNSANSNLGVNVTPNGDTLYFSSAGGTLRAVRGAAGMFEMPIQLPELGSSVEPAITPDELTIFFMRDEDIFISRRTTTADGFGVPTPVTELNTAQGERPSWISPDGCTLFFDSSRDGGEGNFDVYMATRSR